MPTCEQVQVTQPCVSGLYWEVDMDAHLCQRDVKTRSVRFGRRWKCRCSRRSEAHAPRRRYRYARFCVHGEQRNTKIVAGSSEIVRSLT